MEETHPASSSSISQKSIYLWYRAYYDTKSRISGEKSSWYKLDPAQLNYEDSELTLIWEGDLNHASTAVAWNSTIYVIAGNSDPRVVQKYFSFDENNKNRTHEVYYLDTRCTDLGWKMGPALGNPRSEVQIAVRDGKIYAFGGGKSPPSQSEESGYGRGPPRQGFGRGRCGSFYDECDRDDDPDDGPPDANFGEVLDPLTNNWGQIAGPDYTLEKKAKNRDPYTDLEDVSIDLIDGVLVEDSFTDYRYEFESGAWEFVPDYLHKKNRAAIVGDVMYRVNPCIWAYNLNNGRPLPRIVRGLGGKFVSPPVYEHDDEGHPASLVDIGGGKLCMLWQSKKGTHCTKFRVSVHDDGEGVVEALATIEAFRIFCKPTMDRFSSRTNLKDCLAL